MKELEYVKINHVMIVKTQGKQCVKNVFGKLKYGKHTPKSFSALTLKHKNPSATIIIFSTGNITIMGPKTQWGALYVMSLLKDIFDLEIIHINIVNVVVKLSQPSKSEFVKINDLYQWNKKDCDCDEDLFPSCTYMVPNTTIKANFFDSGKIVVTGCNNENTIDTVIKHLIFIINEYYKDKETVKVVERKLVRNEINGDKQNPNDKV
jgi:transcription initiation factor TFIID TATA-box-binding protein